MMIRRFFSMKTQYDLAVVGGGPGGYVAAIKASQLGLKTVCVEKRGALGGTCLNVGCIPSKTLLQISHKYHDMVHAKNWGLIAQNPTYDWNAIQKNKSEIVTSLTKGIEYLFTKNKVDYLRGLGKITSPDTVEVTSDNNQMMEIETKNILIATGSETKKLPNFPLDEKRFISSTGALSLSEVPKRLIVIGAGVIGLELGSVYHRMGSEVIFIEYFPTICPSLDKDICKEFQKALTKDGVKFHFNKKCTKGTYNEDDNGVVVHMEDIKTGEKFDLKADYCLIATGRNPYTKNLGLEELGVAMDKAGRVIINNEFRTNVGNIFAIGDVVDGPMLAHKAEEEGIAVAEFLAGQDIHVNYNAIPGVIYTYPEIAFVGHTEDKLKELGVEYKVGLFPLSANSRYRANLDSFGGMVKILADKKTDRLLGAHIMSPNAGDLIHELVMGIEYGATTEDIARLSHAHPSLSEAIKESALAAYFKAIHI